MGPWVVTQGNEVKKEEEEAKKVASMGPWVVTQGNTNLGIVGEIRGFGNHFRAGVFLDMHLVKLISLIIDYNSRLSKMFEQGPWFLRQSAARNLHIYITTGSRLIGV